MGVHCHVKITGEWFEHSTSGWPNKIHVFYGPDTLNHCVTPFAPKEIWTPDLALTKRALYPWAIGAWSPSRGFDPRTLRLTASHSSDWVKTEWSGLGDSNTWPMEGYIILLQSIALPTELRPGKLPPVFETGLLDSKSKVMTTTLWELGLKRVSYPHFIIITFFFFNLFCVFKMIHD